MASTSSNPIPLMNRASAIIGLPIAFQIIAWVAVILRLYARFRMSHSPGWDDFLVVMAALSVAVGTSFVVGLPSLGLGKHVSALSADQYARYTHWFWAATVSYFISATLIKVSLLVQYLRLFKQNIRLYTVLIALIILISIWGIIFVCMLVFSCTPIKKFWMSVPGHCFGFGSGSERPSVFFASFAVHSALNMAWDIVVLTFPILSLSSLDLEGRRKYAIAGLAGLGAVVVAISTARLASVAETRAGTYPTTDPTWLAPTSIVLSCLEVDVAILCASIPVFWPIISVLTFGKIFVIDEVIVQTESRLSRAHSTGSETELRAYHSRVSSVTDVGRHYKDRYILDLVRPVGQGGTFDVVGGNMTHTVNVERTTVPLNQIERLVD